MTGPDDEQHHACSACGQLWSSDSPGHRVPRSLRKDGFEYAVCDHCGSGWLVRGVESFDASAFYDHGYFTGARSAGYGDYDADAALHARNARARLRRLARSGAHVRPGARLLDIGCATGQLLEQAAATGWDVEGVELSAWAAERAGKRTGARMHASIDSVPDGPFDAICLGQVLEHTPNPHGTLDETRRRIAPTGRVLIETWNATSLIARAMGSHWQQVSPPSVIHLFSRRGLELLSERSGFRLVRFSRTPKWISVGFAMEILAGKYPRLLKPVRPLLRRAGRVPLPYWAGDLVTAILEPSCRDVPAIGASAEESGPPHADEAHS